MLAADRFALASLHGGLLALGLVLAPSSALAQAPPPAPSSAPAPVPVLIAPSPGVAPVPVLVAPSPQPGAPLAVAGAEAPALSPALEQEPIPPLAEEPPPPNRRAYAPYFPVNFAVLHPMSSNAGLPELLTNVSLGVILGRVGYVDGVQVSTVGSILHDLRGAQIGAASLIDESATGLQVGGVFAFTTGALRGAQIAGFLGWADSSLAGVQLSGLINRVSRGAEGIQIAGLSNWSNAAFTGLQIAGGINQTKGEMRGVQIAGALNAAYGTLQGVQIGAFNIGKVRGLQLGLVNVSADTQGTQIGLINVARRSEGLQVGVVNVTDNLRGESLGIASLPREGGIHLVVWGSNSLSGNLGVKFGSKVVYSVLSGAIHREDKDNVFGGGITLGVHFPIFPSLGPGLSVSADVGGYRLVRDPAPVTRHDEMYKLRFLLAYEVVKHFSFFAGGGVHVGIRGGERFDTSLGPEVCGGLEL
jgi:hypothetical protein